MSIITNKISIAKPAIVDGVDLPLDARTVCDTEADFPDIEMPFIGMEIYTRADGKFWIVKSLKSRLIGAITVENAQIDQYEERISVEMLNKKIGDIDSILDSINGEEV